MLNSHWALETCAFHAEHDYLKIQSPFFMGNLFDYNQIIHSSTVRSETFLEVTVSLDGAWASASASLHYKTNC